MVSRDTAVPQVPAHRTYLVLQPIDEHLDVDQMVRRCLFGLLAQTKRCLHLRDQYLADILQAGHPVGTVFLDTLQARP